MRLLSLLSVLLVAIPAAADPAQNEVPPEAESTPVEATPPEDSPPPQKDSTPAVEDSTPASPAQDTKPVAGDAKDATPVVDDAKDATPFEEKPTPPTADKDFGSQQDDRGPIGRGFGERWIATPTVSSNPKLSTAFGATAIVFFRFDDSIASQIIAGGNYSVSKSWTAFGFGRLNFLHDRERIILGLMRGHAANSYDNFMNQGIALESLANILATPVVYYHRLAAREKTDWWAGGQLIYLRMDQSGEDPTSSDIIDTLGLASASALSFGPNVMYDSRDNTNSPQTGTRFLLRGGMWAQLTPPDDTPVFGSSGAQFSQYFSIPYMVLAINADARFTWGAPLIFQSSISQFRAYTVGEQIARNTISAQVESRIPFGTTRFGAAVFGGVATLFDDWADWGDLSTYYPMGGGGFSFMLSKQQKNVIRLEYAQGIQGARGIYLAMGQPFQ